MSIPVEFAPSTDRLLQLAFLTRLAGANFPVRDLLDCYAGAAVAATTATRGFVALAEFEAGGLMLTATAGGGWTDDNRRNRLADRGQDGQSTFTSKVALTGRPVRIADITQDESGEVAPDYRPFFRGTRSVLAVPIALEREARVRGVLNVESDRVDAFTVSDEAFVGALAQAAAQRLASDDLKAREAALTQMGRELTVAPDPKALLQRVVEIAAEILRFEDCSVFLLESHTRRLVLAATRGPLASQITRASYAIGEGLTGSVAEHGIPVRVRDVRSDPRHKGLYREMDLDQMGAFLAVPIRSMEGVIGVLRVLRRKSTSPWFPNDFTDPDAEVLETIASQIGAAMDNARLQERLIQSERMAAWGEMSAMTSHQIGNRIFALKGALNELDHVVDRDGAPNAPLADLKRNSVTSLLDEMRSGIARIDELLGEFRDFVRASALSLKPVDATEITRSAVEETFPKRGVVTLETDFTDEPLPMEADPAKLKRALSELVENAVTLQEPAGGGQLRVETRRLRSDDPLLSGLPLPERSGRNLSEFAYLRFQDTGPGVPASEKERIFRPFVTSRSRGMGLGLAIVKGIIDAHHGSIAEVGTPGEGADFVILLPLK